MVVNTFLWANRSKSVPRKKQHGIDQLTLVICTVLYGIVLPSYIGIIWDYDEKPIKRILMNQSLQPSTRVSGTEWDGENGPISFRYTVRLLFKVSVAVQTGKNSKTLNTVQHAWSVNHTFFDQLYFTWKACPKPFMGGQLEQDGV